MSHYRLTLIQGSCITLVTGHNIITVLADSLYCIARPRPCPEASHAACHTITQYPHSCLRVSPQLGSQT